MSQKSLVLMPGGPPERKFLPYNAGHFWEVLQAARHHSVIAQDLIPLPKEVMDHISSLVQTLSTPYRQTEKLNDSDLTTERI